MFSTKKLECPIIVRYSSFDDEIGYVSYSLEFAPGLDLDVVKRLSAESIDKG